MSAERRIFTVVFGLAMCGGPMLAAEDDQPDAEFLEYLGMWEESDEDWLILDETMVAENEEQDDPAEESEESLEEHDER